jgi:phosphoserine phosphatase RsbU/P
MTQPSTDAALAPLRDRHVYLILVVDDDLTSRVMLEVILRKEGFQVISASSGVEGRVQAESHNPDMILMDINMPGESGLDACKALKAKPATADCPVVFISAQEDVSSKIEGFQAGGVDYITKPYNPAEVLARVRLHIRISHAYRAMVNSHIAELTSLSQSQKILLPTPESEPDAKFVGLFRPCHSIGGDFFDVVHAAEGIYDYLVADVSGHNLGTALPTAALKALIHQNAEMLYSPLESLRLLNRHLRPILAEGQYATLLYVRLNRQRRKLTLLNAGHPYALLLPASGGIELLRQEGDPIGLFDVIQVEPLHLNVYPGDRVLLYSDGLIEQNRMGPVSRRVGLESLMDACDRHRNLAIGNWVETVAQQILPDEGHLSDDALALAFEI